MGSSLDIGTLVRIRTVDASQHWMPGRVVGFRGSGVLVQVFGRHRKTEWIEPGCIRVWKKGQAIDRAHGARRQA